VLRYYRRPLTDLDRGLLAEEMSFIDERWRHLRRFTIAAPLLLLAAGGLFLLLQGFENRALFYLAAFVLAVFLGIVLWVYRENALMLAAREAALRRALDRDEVRVLHCRADNMLAVPEAADEGPGYFFQVEPYAILYLDGQAYYPTNRFPNTDFEVVEVLDEQGVVIAGRINCLGERITAERALTPAQKARLVRQDRLPADMSLIDGALAGVEERLLAGSAVIRPLSETG
jgi:hypothetical protein